MSKNIITEYADKLKKNATVYEIMVKNELTSKNVKFLFQEPIYGIGFTYIPDFLVYSNAPNDDVEFFDIELDGKHHHLPDKKAYDQKRTERLMEIGIKVIRFDNIEVKRDLNSVVNYILNLGVAFCSHPKTETIKKVKIKKLERIKSEHRKSHLKSKNTTSIPNWLSKKEKKKLNRLPLLSKEEILAEMEHHKSMGTDNKKGRGHTSFHYAAYCRLRKQLATIK